MSTQTNEQKIKTVTHTFGKETKVRCVDRVIAGSHRLSYQQSRLPISLTHTLTQTHQH